MKEETTYSYDILNEYQSIATQNASQKISFYKKHESFLVQIPINEKLDIVLDFLCSLFELGRYNEYLDRCDEVIDSLFDSQLFPIFRKKEVQKLLFHKAGSYLSLHDLDRSENTMRVLVKMDDSNNKLYQELLFQIFKNKRLLVKFQARGIVIALILSSAILSIWIALVIQPHYPDSLLRFKAWAIGFFGSGVFLWVGFIAYNYYKSYQDAKLFIRKMK